MFGKRSGSAPAPAPAPARHAATPAEGVGLAVPVLSDTDGLRPGMPERAPEPRPVITVQETHRSEEYYQTKSMIFGALIEAIDLAQLSRLDAEAAREEIRDIVS
ncbi:MAG TPA: CpaF family protein, partial [Beijerinckiaceae bacterium]|nr:CpaF family protein [Beijerinckiaceae bacterium]